ncbi:MAG TPA: DUF4388 domain-containing protein [Candidatus Saccharimonadales bacterium]|nr:DUF4388 domain-containing protein [Candidatus Saccharimonadales bacterium]
MTLRGQIADFPIETVLQLLASTGKTGQLEVRGDGQSGSLGFDGGRLVSAATGDDAGETALGAVFTFGDGEFEFIPWKDAPAANLSGDLDQLLDRAVVERNKIVAIREIVPSDTLRFRLSERAAERGEVTLTADQWRTLLAVNGERDVRGVADHLKVGRLVALDTLSGLVTAGFIDTVEPPAEPAEPPPAEAPAAAYAPAAVPAVDWPAPVAEPAPDPRLSETGAAGWQSATPIETATEWAAPVAEEPAPDAPPANEWARPKTPAPQNERNEWAPPSPAPANDASEWSAPARTDADLRSDLAAALDARMSAAAPTQGVEQPLSETPLDVAPERAAENDARLAAITGIFDTPETPQPDRIDEWRRGSAPVAESEPVRADLQEWATPAAEPQPEEKKKGLFGFLKRDEPAHDRAEQAATSAAVEPGASSRAGQLASFANELLTEYNSGQYGKGQVDDRIANLLMRVDEQADPIDRPLPIVDDRIDVAALERENVAEPQAVPYLALLVSQVYEDAERAFGRDKAKKGYRAAQQHVFGNDASALAAPDVAGRLPKL